MTPRQTPLWLCVAVLAAGGGISASPALAASSPKRAHVGPRATPRVRVVLTTANLSYALTRQPNLRFKTSTVRRLPNIRVDDSIQYQRITGFGAGMSDSSAWLIYDVLAPGPRAALLKALFSPQGIHLNFMRVPIGASDFTVSGVPYSYDDLPAGQSDPPLRRFSIPHDWPYIIPALREMLANNPTVEILASLWSPPPWMKANDAFNNLYGGGSLLPADYQVLAHYFVRFIRAYRHDGVPVAAVTAQNEPLSGTAYPGMELPPFQEAWFIARQLQPALNAVGLPTKIYGLDGGTNFGYVWQLMSTAVRRTLSGIAWHCYGGMGSYGWE